MAARPELNPDPESNAAIPPHLLKDLLHGLPESHQKTARLVNRMAVSSAHQGIGPVCFDILSAYTVAARAANSLNEQALPAKDWVPSIHRELIESVTLIEKWSVKADLAVVLDGQTLNQVIHYVLTFLNDLINRIIQSILDNPSVQTQNIGMEPSDTSKSVSKTSETVLNTIKMFIENITPIVDPRTGFGPFPPDPRKIAYSDVRRGKGHTRMTVDQYLADDQIGFGAYTSRKLMALSWLENLDKPLSNALRYQATVDITATGLGRGSPGWMPAYDAYYLERGVMTLGHLNEPPSGFEWEAKFLMFAVKQSLPIPQGSRRIPREHADDLGRDASD